MKHKLVLIGVRNVIAHERELEKNQPEEWRTLFSELRENKNMVVLATSYNDFSVDDQRTSGLTVKDFDDICGNASKSFPQAYQFISERYGIDITKMFLIDSVFKSVKTIQECGGNGIEYESIESTRAALQKNGNLKAPG